MPEVHVYVSARDKALIESLPPGVRVADMLRQSLDGLRSCPHDRRELRCVRCGNTIDIPSPSDDDLVVTPTGSPSDDDPIDTLSLDDETAGG